MSDPVQFVPTDRRPLLSAYMDELRRMNRALNLVARSSEARIAEDHVAHALTLALRCFPDGSTVVDWGTGGGLPAIPLAICFPEVQFVAVDSIRKKTDAVAIMARRLGLTNVSVVNGRAESWTGSADYAVSRATARLSDLWVWTRPVLSGTGSAREGCWNPGLLCLKGGELEEEWDEMERLDPFITGERIPLSSAFDRQDWAHKYIVHVSQAEPS